MKKKALLALFGSFFKIGLFTFGGGYAMIALIQGEFVEKRGWISQDEFLDMAAIAESTPGPIAINAATYIGYKVGGLWGSILGTLGVCIPSFVVIYLISLFFDRFLELRFVARAFRGIQACVCYLILSAGLRMLGGMKKSPLNLTLWALTVLALVGATWFALNLSSIALILLGAAVGLGAYFLERRKEEKG